MGKNEWGSACGHGWWWASMYAWLCWGLERDVGNLRCTEALELCTWISLGRFSLSSGSQELIVTQFLCEDHEKSVIDISTVYLGLEVILWLLVCM